MSLSQLFNVVDPCLADRPSPHTKTCMEKKAQEILLILLKMTSFTSPSMGSYVEEWELTAVGVEIVIAPVPGSLQNLAMCTPPTVLFLDKP